MDPQKPIEQTPATPPQPPQQEQTPAPAPTTPPVSSIDEKAKAMKGLGQAAVCAIIIGVLMLGIGLGVGLFLSAIYMVAVPFGLLYLIFGIKLKKESTDLGQRLKLAKILMILVLVHMILSIVTLTSPGLLLFLLLLLLSLAVSHLHKAGLVTTGSLLTAKVK